MMSITGYFTKMTGFTATPEQEILLKALTNDKVKKLLATAGRGFSKTLCSAVAQLWYAEKSIEEDPLLLMIVSPQQTLYTYVNDMFGKSEVLIAHRVKSGVYTEVPVTGFELDNGTKCHTLPATNKVRSNRADILTLDETADIPEEIIKSAMGCLTGSLNRLILISTCHKRGYFTTRAMNPKKYDYKVLQFSGETCPWLDQTVERAKVELTAAEYAMEVLGRAPTMEERSFYPSKNVTQCVKEDVVSEGGVREAGLDFAFSPCDTVLCISEKNGVRFKTVFIKSWRKRPIEDSAPEIGELLTKYSVSYCKADGKPPEYRGHVEKYTKVPIAYLDMNYHKEAILGQAKNKLMRGMVEIPLNLTQLIIQIKNYRLHMRTGDDMHDAWAMSIYQPLTPLLKLKPKPTIYMRGEIIQNA